MVNVLSQTLQLLNPKQTLGWVDEDAMLVEALKDQPYILLVLVWVSTDDENIGNIGIAEVQTTQDLINGSLEGLGSVMQAEKHLEELKQPKEDSYGFLQVVGWFHRDLVVGTYQFNPGEGGGTMQ